MKILTDTKEKGAIRAIVCERADKSKFVVSAPKAYTEVEVRKLIDAVDIADKARVEVQKILLANPHRVTK